MNRDHQQAGVAGPPAGRAELDTAPVLARQSSTMECSSLTCISAMTRQMTARSARLTAALNRKGTVWFSHSRPARPHGAPLPAAAPPVQRARGVLIPTPPNQAGQSNKPYYKPDRGWLGLVVGTNTGQEDGEAGSRHPCILDHAELVAGVT